ncbi:HutP [Clostridium homopropionicum DSM 5847]|uniref:Hut operon positive regulatory protein n=1 Tax=Clostridium homopropionicum DSM 5847 TaxID=1121318 RepID=A0A0L6Z8W8_9CLOT|nr:HutP family protein [Clostridium homopropionicum]KOA19426.1 HutP [Clostridium homopropionicum DSM 5847]SFG69387.1 HutP protein [Clostridium homopropionicum]
MINSIDVAKAAIKMATSERNEEKTIHEKYKAENILTAAVDVGGNVNDSIHKIMERALVASKRMNIIKDCHIHDGAVVGAAREAIMQVAVKANGLSVGGKIGIARGGDHVIVCIFMNIGLLHLNEVAIGLGHRSIPQDNI